MQLVHPCVTDTRIGRAGVGASLCDRYKSIGELECVRPCVTDTRALSRVRYIVGAYLCDRYKYRESWSGCVLV